MVIALGRLMMVAKSNDFFISGYVGLACPFMLSLCEWPVGGDGYRLDKRWHICLVLPILHRLPITCRHRRKSESEGYCNS